MRDAHRAEERRLLLLTAAVTLVCSALIVAAGLGWFDALIVRP